MIAACRTAELPTDVGASSPSTRGQSVHNGDSPALGTVILPAAVISATFAIRYSFHLVATGAHTA